MKKQTTIYQTRLTIVKIIQRSSAKEFSAEDAHAFYFS